MTTALTIAITGRTRIAAEFLRRLEQVGRNPGDAAAEEEDRRKPVVEASSARAGYRSRPPLPSNLLRRGLAELRILLARRSSPTHQSTDLPSRLRWSQGRVSTRTTLRCGVRSGAGRDRLSAAELGGEVVDHRVDLRGSRAPSRRRAPGRRAHRASSSCCEHQQARGREPGDLRPGRRHRRGRPRSSRWTAASARRRRSLSMRASKASARHHPGDGAGHEPSLGPVERDSGALDHACR